MQAKVVPSRACDGMLPRARNSLKPRIIFPNSLAVSLPRSLGKS
jgi:hypothetical protein